MKLDSKSGFQTEAVWRSMIVSRASRKSGLRYRIDPGRCRLGDARLDMDEGFRNNDLALPPDACSRTSRRAAAPESPFSEALKRTAVRINLDIEMETGTGKTYCYIKTMFELNKRYGWSKFIVVVPSIAIREGVCAVLEITAEHFLEQYGKRARSFIYNSKQLHKLESFLRTLAST